MPSTSGAKDHSFQFETETHKKVKSIIANMMPEDIRRQRRSRPRNICCVLVIFIILIIAQAVVGRSHITDCRDIAFILIYLMGFGGGILLLCCIKECSIKIAVLFFIWFIVGNVFIISAFNDFREGKLHCDETLYLVAFMSTILTYSLLFALCCAYVHDEEESNDEPF